MTLAARVRQTLARMLALDLEPTLLAIGRQESRTVRSAAFRTLAEAEFKVFSQWGEDGIIQYLTGKVPIPNEVFVEFGVESYRESNTRFLLQNDNWRGLILDGGTEHQRFTARRGLIWRHDLTVVSAFVTRENINRLITEHGVRGDIGLLSVDIDGNDYWVLEAIDAVSPRILVVEYNAVFGAERRVTVPYRPDFVRTSAHFSNLYYGASLPALAELAERKGYDLVGCNRAGNNAFFVRRDVRGELRPLRAEEAYVEARFSEARAADGSLSLVRGRADKLAVIAGLPLVDLDQGVERPIADLFGRELEAARAGTDPRG